MSNINYLVMQALNEEKGQTAGAEMYNDAPLGGSGQIGGLYSEPGLKPANKAGDPVVKQGGGDQSSFDVTPDLQDGKKRTGEPEVKYGDSSAYAKALNLVRDVNRSVVKSSEVSVGKND